VTPEDLIQKVPPSVSAKAEAGAARTKTEAAVHATRHEHQAATAEVDRLAEVGAALRRRIDRVDAELVAGEVLKVLSDPKKRGDVSFGLAPTAEKLHALEGQATVLRVAQEFMESIEQPSAPIRELQAHLDFVVASSEWVLADAMAQVGDLLTALGPSMTTDGVITVSLGPDSKPARYSAKLGELDAQWIAVRDELKQLIKTAQKGTQNENQS
jgi:hypothetical protein